MSEPLTYTVTPGPELLARMGQSWTLYATPPAHFTYGPDGEPPGPVTMTLTEEQVVEHRGSGYVVEPAAPEPLHDDARVEKLAAEIDRALEGGAEFTPVERDGDGGPGIDPIGGAGREEEMEGEPGEGIQIDPGTQGDGSPAEPVKRRKN
jgi:hypothetical protein